MSLSNVTFTFTFISRHCCLFCCGVQELALLCINSIRKDLNDPNPRARANSLRTITGIRVRIQHSSDQLFYMGLVSQVHVCDSGADGDASGDDGAAQLGERRIAVRSQNCRSRSAQSPQVRLSFTCPYFYQRISCHNLFLY
jgi:hypothetical protein